MSLKEECEAAAKLKAKLDSIKEMEKEREKKREEDRKREDDRRREEDRKRDEQRDRGRGARSRSRDRERSRNRSRDRMDRRSRSRSPRGRGPRRASPERDRHLPFRRRTPTPPRTAARFYSTRDPKTINQRIFIGNMPTDQMTEGEVRDFFNKYGTILAVSIHNGFGFVQYTTEEEARKAANAENGSLWKGQRIDVNMAAEGKKKEKRRSPPPGERPDFERGRPMGPRGDSPPPFRDRGLPPRGMSPPRGGRDPFGDRDRFRDPYADPYAPLPPTRDPFLDPYARDPIRDPLRDPVRDPLRDPLRDPARPLPAAVPPTIERPPFDCLIIILSQQLRNYSDQIDRRLRDIGLVTDLRPAPAESDVPKMIDDSLRRKIPYAITLNLQNEVHRSLTLNILHGSPQEHRNMPFEDAMNLVTRNFDTYLKDLREKALKAVPASSRSGSAPPPEFVAPDKNTTYLLNLLADNRILTVQEIDTVIVYLEKRRRRFIEVKGVPDTPRPSVASGPPPVAPVGPPIQNQRDNIILAQHKIQDNILGMLNGQENVMARKPPPPPPREPPPPSAAAHPPSGLGTINFDNPSVKQALDNLIQSGPNLLASINAISAAPSAGTPIPPRNSAGYSMPPRAPAPPQLQHWPPQY